MDVDGLLSGDRSVVCMDSMAMIETARRKIVLYNLPLDTFGTDLAEFFKQFGEIESCRVERKQVGERECCLGFVQFKTREARKLATNKPTLEFNGHEIEVRIFHTKNKKEHKQTSNHPLIPRNFACCRVKSCGYLAESNFHCSLVDSPDQPHPCFFWNPFTYSRSELVKLNPRKTRMPGYFQTSGAVARICPELFRASNA